MIEDKLLEVAIPRMKNLKVDDVRIGLGYTAVLNSAGGLGLAYTLRERVPLGHCTSVKMAGQLVGIDLEQAALMFTDSRNVLNAAIGLAAINSVADTDNPGFIKGDLMDILDIQKGEWVGMVGYFAPLVKKIKKKTRHLFIIEDKVEYRRKGTYKIFDEIMSNCQVMIITATTLINKTLNEILENTANARIRALLGPSTPLYQAPFRGNGIDFISGMVVNKPQQVLEIVSQGGGTGVFKKYCAKVNLKIEENQD